MMPKSYQPMRMLNVGSWGRVRTPLGTFHVAVLDGAVVQTALPNQDERRFLDELTSRYPSAQFREGDADPLVQKACVQIEEYARGERRTFDLPVRLEGTEFQRKVWSALAKIPYGQARSYNELAREIGRPGASRAVGQANHNNPVAPIIPCHRVIAAGGGLGGYGGGLDLKRQMLELEGIQVE